MITTSPVALRELTIVASTGCNRRCSYCWQRGGPPRSPSWRVVRDAAAKLMASTETDVRVSFTGGEPLLAAALIERTVAHVTSHRRAGQRVRYKLLTNGLLLDDAILAFLARHAFDVQVSFDGDRVQQEQRSAGSFEPLDRLFRNLRQHHPSYLAQHVSVAATVTSRSIDRLADSVSYLLSTGAGAINISPAVETEAVDESVAARLEEQFNQAAGILRQHYARTGHAPLTPFRTLRPRPRPGRVPWRCAAPMNRSLAVDADGTSAACLAATDTYAPAPPRVLGPALRALRRLSMADVTADPEDVAGLKLFKRSAARYSSFGPCRRCRWMRECVVCPLAPAKHSTWVDALRVPDLLCAFRRSLFECRARLPQRPPFTRP